MEKRLPDLLARETLENAEEEKDDVESKIDVDRDLAKPPHDIALTSEDVLKLNEDRKLGEKGNRAVEDEHGVDVLLLGQDKSWGVAEMCAVCTFKYVDNSAIVTFH